MWPTGTGLRTGRLAVVYFIIQFSMGAIRVKGNRYQAMPTKGLLARNFTLPSGTLMERIAPFRECKVYSYVVDTVDYHEGRLYQTGSGPNFQGDLVTLCSCKHQMRTYLEPETWEGVWVAGFTGSTDLGSNRLFYLMRVSKAFASHRELWLSEAISDETKVAKAAHLDRFGDIYQPKNTVGDAYRHRRYLGPCKTHVHCEPGDWRKDIGYVTRHGRRAALLVGEPDYSFLFDRPTIASPFKIRRGERKSTLGELFPED